MSAFTSPCGVYVRAALLYCLHGKSNRNFRRGRAHWAATQKEPAPMLRKRQSVCRPRAVALLTLVVALIGQLVMPPALRAQGRAGQRRAAAPRNMRDPEIAR